MHNVYCPCPVLQVDVCQMELTQNKLTWKRASQLVKIGTICHSDDLNATKEKCAQAVVKTECISKLVLIVKGAVVDSSAFVNLEGFLNALTPQQRSHLVLGVGIKVNECVCMYIHILW